MEMSKKNIITNTLFIVYMSQYDFGKFTCKFNDCHQNKTYNFS